MCEEPMSASLPEAIYERVNRYARHRGFQNGRVVADLVCFVFGTEEEREILRKHGRILDGIDVNFLPKNLGDGK